MKTVIFLLLILVFTNSEHFAVHWYNGNIYTSAVTPSGKLPSGCAQTGFISDFFNQSHVNEAAEWWKCDAIDDNDDAGTESYKREKKQLALMHQKIDQHLACNKPAGYGYACIWQQTNCLYLLPQNLRI